MDDRYYSEEINYLLQEGKEFAGRHPQKARMLHLDDIRSRDPNVERLIESFAFLTSRIRKRLDDDYSQIADGLMSLMWPGYINIIPSFCLIDLCPTLWSFHSAMTVPRGSEIDSEPTSKGLQCRFRTCFDVSALPIELTDVQMQSSGSSSQLDLSFNFSDEVDLASLAGHKLKVQLWTEFSQAWQLYDLLLGRDGKKPITDHVRLVALGEEGKTVADWKLSPDVIRPSGLTRDESLLPMSKSSLWCFELIRDFFLFPEKFQALEVDVLDLLAGFDHLEGFQLKLRMSRPWPSNLRPSKDHFRLNTVPAVNLFAHDGNPLRLDRLLHKYTVRGDVTHPEYFQVYSVNSVESIEIGTNERKRYRPLYTTRFGGGEDEFEKIYYHLERSKSSWGGLETFISFVDPSSSVELPKEEVLSLSLTCTNGRLAGELGPGQISDPVSDFHSGLKPANLSHPTPFYVPEIEKDSLWRWLSHASLNYLSLGSPDQLRSLLGLHDFSNSKANEHKIAGIRSVEMGSTRALLGGALIPGISVHLTLDEEHFSDRGEIQLFAQVLSAFMTGYASINSYIQLTVTAEPSGHKIVVQPRIGESYQL